MPFDQIMPSRIEIFLLTFIMILLSSCSAIIPKEHLIPKEKLVVSLQKQFPLHREKGNGQFSITLDIPKLSLMPEQKRVVIDDEFTAKALMVDIEGKLKFSSELRYDHGLKAIFLKEARLDYLQFRQINAFSEVVRSLINRMFKESIEKDPLYKFKPDELTFIGEKIDITSIEIVPEGIMLKIHAN